MNKITITAAVASLVLFAAFKQVELSSWSVDKAHAKLGFTITHLMVSDVEGSFKIFNATITGSNDDFSDAVVEMKADVNSIDTDNEQRDTHLKNADFFDAAKYPDITFKSKTFKKVSDNTYTVTGDLTMHGVTKTIVLQAVAKSGINPMTKKAVTGFKVTGILKRTDFNIAASTPSAMLGDEVAIIANTEFTKN